MAKIFAKAQRAIIKMNTDSSFTIKCALIDTNFNFSFVPQADIIVNNTSSSLALGGGTISCVVLKAAGSEIQDECKTKYPAGVKFGEFVETVGGNLNCDVIYHGCVSNWSQGAGEKVHYYSINCKCFNYKYICISGRSNPILYYLILIMTVLNMCWYCTIFQHGRY